jgi:cytochrome o ubiquinol oxidase operon protein cyoD
MATKEYTNLEELDKRLGGSPLSLKSYLFGLLLCVILTLAAYFLTTQKMLSGRDTVIVIVALGILQAAIQLIFFLHLSTDKRAYWNTLIFFFMTLFTGILVIGSLWIMFNLDQRVMPSEKEMEEYMLRQ